ncbi:MAG: L-aspartate oxidase [Bacteroidetes bacterium HGW-Bacteroidetes-14]|nr:MAG: L-aspartate oxidase [Bacteroidetes bacterium HGW-Bacteroidetes-14]
MHHYDYLIAGSGLAGLYAAFRASRYGKVAVITKQKVTDSNTFYAQGGIAAVTDEEDTPKFHADDTIVAGRGLCDPEAVDVFVNEGPIRIQELIAFGMHFDMEKGQLELGLEGGHSKRRVIHAGGDITGRKITEFMITNILSNPNITLFENYRILEILKSDNRCFGLKVWNHDSDSQEIFTGHNTILALGGASAIYERTTNPSTAVGDGVALAWEAGCEVADMEFIQFHPTTLYTKDNKSYLISEAVRGEGAHLINSRGERFMLNKHPLAELAPRDVVARSIFSEIQEQKINNKHKEDFIWLSLRHLDPDRIKKRFPHIFQKCAELGFDMTDKIPVTPAAHYMVGGVKCDINGQTGVNGLYVCGELASTGIMGANRLASNSLSECLVFGFRAVEHSASAASSNLPVLNSDQPVSIEEFYRDPSLFVFDNYIKESIASIMTEFTGIVRTKEGLTEGLDIITNLRNEITSLKLKNEYYTHTALFLTTTASLIVTAALAREESRGGHFRSDFPEENQLFKKHSLQQKNKELKLIL